jgi:hypothetical protein
MRAGSRTIALVLFGALLSTISPVRATGRGVAYIGIDVGGGGYFNNEKPSPGDPQLHAFPGFDLRLRVGFVLSRFLMIGYEVSHLGVVVFGADHHEAAITYYPFGDHGLVVRPGLGVGLFRKSRGFSDEHTGFCTSITVGYDFKASDTVLTGFGISFSAIFNEFEPDYMLSAGFRLTFIPASQDDPGLLDEH